MLNRVVQKLKTISLWHLLWVSILLSELFTGVIVCVMSYIFYGRISFDYLITGGITAFLVSMAVVFLVIYLINQLRESEKHAKNLRDNIEFQEKILETATDAIFVTDVEGKFVLVNSRISEFTGISARELIGHSFLKLFSEEITHELAEQFKKLIHEGVDLEGYEIELPDIDEQKRLIVVNAAPLKHDGKIAYVVGTAEDVTARRKMKEELIKMDKLESIGILAGGIAHDFNNLLTGILGNITLAKMYADPGDKIHERLEKAEKVSLRVKDLTQQLLTFSKGGTPIKKTVDIKESLRESIQFVLHGSNVICEFKIENSLWPVDADEGQISQVIHNLVINANQAMPRGGTVQVFAENTIIDQDHLLPIRDGRYIKLTLKDQGVGIAKENLEKIFDPYFTTKQAGNGLGLAICYSIIKNHDGYVTAESEPGKGSSFVVYLPASNQSVKKKTGKRSRPIAMKGRILLMDDEEVVRDVARQMLNEIGYQADLAMDGEEAIELYQQAEARGISYDLVIMDLTVPGGMGGKEAIKQLKKTDPGVKAIVSSGYSNDPIMANYEDHGFCGVIIKPYTVEELAEVLHKLT